MSTMRHDYETAERRKEKRMTRRLDLSRAAPRRSPLPDNLTDQQWWADAEQRYEEYWREFVGSPEFFAEGGRWFYGSGELVRRP